MCAQGYPTALTPELALLANHNPVEPLEVLDPEVREEIRSAALANPDLANGSPRTASVGRLRGMFSRLRFPTARDRHPGRRSV